MPVRPDGFMSEEIIRQELQLPNEVVENILAQVHPLIKKYADSPDTVYYGPETINEIEDWLIDHPEVYDQYLGVHHEETNPFSGHLNAGADG